MINTVTNYDKTKNSMANVFLQFPASLQILADRNILDYMHYETLMFALTHLFHRLMEEMQNEKR